MANHTVECPSCGEDLRLSPTHDADACMQDNMKTLTLTQLATDIVSLKGKMLSSPDAYQLARAYLDFRNTLEFHCRVIDVSDVLDRWR